MRSGVVWFVATLGMWMQAANSHEGEPNGPDPNFCHPRDSQRQSSEPGRSKIVTFMGKWVPLPHSAGCNLGTVADAGGICVQMEEL